MATKFWLASTAVKRSKDETSIKPYSDIKRAFCSNFSGITISVESRNVQWNCFKGGALAGPSLDSRLGARRRDSMLSQRGCEWPTCQIESTSFKLRREKGTPYCKMCRAISARLQNELTRLPNAYKLFDIGLTRGRTKTCRQRPGACLQRPMLLDAARPVVCFRNDRRVTAMGRKRQFDPLSSSCSAAPEVKRGCKPRQTTAPVITSPHLDFGRCQLSTCSGWSSRKPPQAFTGWSDHVQSAT